MSTPAAHGGAAPPPPPAPAERVTRPDTGRHVDALAPEAGIIERVAAVMADCELLQKTERNEQQGYSFASEGAMVEMLRPLMAEAGLVLHATLAMVDRYEVQFRNSKGTGCSVQVEYRLIGVNGDELPASQWQGDATDNADKALPKALTAAKKSYLVHTFLLSTGMDPDSGGEFHQQDRDTGQVSRDPDPVASDKEVRRVFAVAQSAGVDREKVRLFAHLASRSEADPLGHSIHALRRSQIRQVVHWVENYQARAADYDVQLGQMAALLDEDVASTGHDDLQPTDDDDDIPF